MLTMQRLFDPGQAVNAPPGFRYIPDFVTPEEEATILALVPSLQFEHHVIRDQPSKRDMTFFGGEYGTRVRGVPMPPIVEAVRDRAAALTDTPGRLFSHAALMRYPAGAGIGWHRDYPEYGPVVIGFSLAAPCTMKLREIANPRVVFAQELRPRSLYFLAGSARRSWQHSIPPVKELRFSLTIRAKLPEGERLY